MNEILNSESISTIFNISVSTLNKRIEHNRFPRPDFVLGRTRCWRKETVLNVLEEKELHIKRMKQMLEGDIYE